MTTNALEKALWRMSTNPADTERYRVDASGFAGEFRLDADEREMLEAFDVGRLASRDVNSLLLLMAFNVVKGFDKMPEYMQAMAQAQSAGPN